MNFFSKIADKLSNKLSRTRDKLVGTIDTLLSGFKKVDPELLNELEEVWRAADLGTAVAGKLIEKVRKDKINDPDAVRNSLKEGMLSILTQDEGSLNLPEAGPAVIVIIGGKVIIAAADTFRAAAIEQIVIWGERSGAEVIRHSDGSDPGAVVFDALASARAKGADVLIVDTAGRLHTKINLMEELKKIRRILEREHPGSPHEVLLVLDATTGQNALSQARLFNKDIGVTGIVLTKLDGTAKGGIILSITEDLRIPVKMIGVGEGLEDLKDFDAREFVDALVEQT